MILLSGKLREKNTKSKTGKRKTNGKSNKNKSADKIQVLPNHFFGSLTVCMKRNAAHKI